MKRFLLAAVAAIMLLTACQSAPTAEQVLGDASENMTSAESMKFEISRVGDPVEVTLGDLAVGVAGARGEYQAPDKVHAVVSATMGGLASEAEVLWIGETAYLKHPLVSPSYTAFPVEGFNAPAIFSSESGIPSVLAGLSGAQLGEPEDVDGIQAYHITATAPGETLTAITGAALAAGDATLDIWIAVETMQLIKVEITESNGNGWLLEFYDYGVPVEIPSPDA